MIFLTVVLVIVILCGAGLGVMLNSSRNELIATQSQLSITQAQLSSIQSQVSNAQAQLSRAETNSSSIDVVIYPVLANGNSYSTTPYEPRGVPFIAQGDEINIYGAGFLVGENVTFQISDGNGSFEIGTVTVVNTAGVFNWFTYANWNNYQWQQNGALWGSITATGDKGSKAVVFIQIGTD